MQADARPIDGLYSPRQILLASVLGGPLAGAVLMALNYRRLGRRAVACQAVLLGGTALVALLALGFVLRASATGTGLGVGAACGTSYIAERVQGTAYKEHIKRGGRRASSWRAAGVGLCSMAIVVAGILACVLSVQALHPDWMEPKVAIRPGEEVYFTGDATEDDARRLARFLTQEGVFDGRGRKTVLLAKGDRGYTVSLVVPQKVWEDDNAVLGLETLAVRISNFALDHRTVEIRLCDSSMTTKRVVRSSP